MISPRCIVIQDQLARYVDGALSEEATRAVRDHLQLCGRCLEAERMARAIPAMLSGPLGPLPSSTMLPRVLSALHERQRRERIERRLTATVAAAAIVFTAAALASARPSLQFWHLGETAAPAAAARVQDASLTATKTLPSLGSGSPIHLTPTAATPTPPPTKAPKRCTGQRAPAGAAAAAKSSCASTQTQGTSSRR